ncbi:SDR family oxidoreductase [Pseudomonas sp. HR96]|uniref:SDR family NAD(P)-dependent oxidoreductase n=1 Tax=Pseudomonas sp. HR96 TaxID=1027966 RepID=UPI002A756EFE|nr:SDR family oxidoreductase [Pseudomonas sp. HR96]WPP00646.1 SDR family oxidoreductase [Pseudomonas sp. HR96]
MNLQGKNVLITGGNSGIGLATARLMLAHGARVAITGRDPSKLEVAAAELGNGVLALQADLTLAGDVQALSERLGSEFGQLDVVFANAGIGGSTPLGSTTLEAFELILRTNLTSVFFTLQAVLPLMADGGAIVFNGSVMRELGSPGSSAYSATKAGISGMAKVFAAELAPRGIRVNTVIPGATRTPIWTRGDRSGSTLDGTEAFLAPHIPLGRLAEPEETANAVLFLATAAGITGAEVVVDGGATGAPYGAPIFRQP